MACDGEIIANQFVVTSAWFIVKGITGTTVARSRFATGRFFTLSVYCKVFGGKTFFLKQGCVLYEIVGINRNDGR